jgi:DNA-binding Lrp family transcriptional regulator
MSKELDLLDLKILFELQLNGRISITDLAKKIEASRPTTSNRLKRLIDEEYAIIRGGLNMNRMGYKMTCVGLEVRNESSRKEVERCLKACPRVLNIFRTPEKANIHIAIWGEDDRTINSTIESFRDLSNVEIVYTHNLGAPIFGDVVFPVTMEKVEKTSCGKNCGSCYRYDQGWCIGCPMTFDYKDPVVVK